jgi:hypothetical protein
MKKAITFLILFIFFHFSSWAQTWTFTPVSGTNYTPNSALFVTATIDAGEGGYDGTLTCVGCVSGSAICVTSGRNIICTTNAPGFVTPASGAVVFTARATKNNKTTYDDVATYSESPLPIELTFFNAFLEGHEVHLEWSTASEVNSWYYSVEHSTNGRDFNEVGAVDAAGFSNTTQNYGYIHRPLTGGAHYYRLKMVDQDGTYKYSPLQVVQMNSMSAVVPFRAWSDGGQVWIEDLVAAESGRFQILDMQGRILSGFDVAQGMDSRISFQMPAVPGGIYLLRWQPASGTPGQTVKFRHTGY